MKLLSFSAHIDKVKTLFEDLNVDVISGESQDLEKIDYILIDSESQLQDITQEYNLVQENITLICWMPILNMREFLLVNGRLADLKGLFELNLAQKVISEIVEGDFHHESDFQNFQTNSEVITNIFQATKNFDELAQTSFLNNFDPVLIKTNVDHQMMYLSYLQQAGIANYPMELSFSFNELECFSTISVPVEKFSSEYIADSFYKMDSQSSFSHLLTIVLDTSNHVSFTYFEKLGTLKIRCFWNKYIKVSSSLQINSIKSVKYVDKKNKRNLNTFESFMGRLKNQAEIIKSIQNKELPNSYLDMHEKNQDVSKVLTEKDFQELFEFVKDQIDDTSAITINGLEQIIESFTNIASLKEIQDDVVEVLARKIKNENFLQAYSQLVQDTEQINTITGQGQDQVEDKMVVDFSRAVISSLDIAEMKSSFGEEYSDEIIKIKGFIDQHGNNRAHRLKAFRDEIQKSALHKVIGERLEQNDKDYKRILASGDVTDKQIEDVIRIKSDKSSLIEKNLTNKLSDIKNEVALDTLRVKTVQPISTDPKSLEHINSLEKQLEAYRKANNELHEKVNLYKNNSSKETYTSPTNSKTDEKVQESQVKTISAAKEDTVNLESHKKKWMQEIRKRDILLERLKDSASSIDAQRLNQIRSLETRLNRINQNTDINNIETYKRKLTSTESKLDVSIKAGEIYKRKFDELSTRLAKFTEKDKEEQTLAIELRALKRMKVQSDKEIKVFEEQSKLQDKKYQEVKESNKKAILKSASLEDALKQKSLELIALENTKNTPDKEEGTLVNKKELALIEDLKLKNKELEEKLAGEIKKSMQQSILAARKASTPSLDLKEKRMDKQLEKAREQIRKAKEEVTSAKKDLFDLKNENTSMNHKLSDLEREVKKYKRFMAENKKDAA